MCEVIVLCQAWYIYYFTAKLELCMMRDLLYLLMISNMIGNKTEWSLVAFGYGIEIFFEAVLVLLGFLSQPAVGAFALMTAVVGVLSDVSFCWAK